MKKSVTRKQLYDLVWSKAMWKLAPEFGMSGNGLAKLCGRADIPVPERGYWAKLQHGKKVVKPRLRGDQDATITIEASETTRSQLEANMPRELSDALDAERAQTEPIQVPKSPKPHSLVESWGRKQALYGTQERLTATESRRRRLASVLFRELEKRGFGVEAETPEKFKFRLLGAALEVAFRESTEMVKIPADPKKPYSYERTEYHGTGLLRFRIENYTDVPIRREFKETPEKPLESRLRDIIIASYVAVEAERQRNERFAEQERRRREAEIRRWEVEEQQRKEKERVDALFSELSSWEKASRLRAYIGAAVAAGSTDEEWATWARGVADRLDPLKATG